MNSTINHHRIRQFIQNHPRLINTLLVITSISLTLVLFEIGFRLWLTSTHPKVQKILKNYQEHTSVDKSQYLFKSHPYLSYTRSDTFYKDNGLQIHENHFTFKKPPNTLRIACLGGSTTMNKYPVYLKDDLKKRRSDLNFEVMDFGTDGWTLMESTINYMIRVSDFSPDIILVHHGINEAPPRIWPNFKPDYSHFRTSWSGGTPWLLKWFTPYSQFLAYHLHNTGHLDFELQNHVIHRRNKTDRRRTAPDNITLQPFIRSLENLHTLTQKNNTLMILAPVPFSRKSDSDLMQKLIQEQTNAMRGFSTRNHIPRAETDHLMLEHQDWFNDLAHVNLNGYYLKSQVFAKVILNEWNYRETGIREPLGLKNRELIIRWNNESDGVESYQVYTRRDDFEDYKFLARVSPHGENKLVWKRNDPIINQDFIQGPLLGHRYVFRIYITYKDNRPFSWIHQQDLHIRER